MSRHIYNHDTNDDIARIMMLMIMVIVVVVIMLMTMVVVVVVVMMVITINKFSPFSILALSSPPLFSIPSTIFSPFLP